MEHVFTLDEFDIISSIDEELNNLSDDELITLSEEFDINSMDSILEISSQEVQDIISDAEGNKISGSTKRARDFAKQSAKMDADFTKNIKKVKGTVLVVGLLFFATIALVLKKIVSYVKDKKRVKNLIAHETDPAKREVLKRQLKAISHKELKARAKLKQLNDKKNREKFMKNVSDTENNKIEAKKKQIKDLKKQI